MENALSIEVASNILGVCKQTLRRWDETGKLKAARSESGYRLYHLSDLQKHIPGDKAKPFLKWAGGKSQLLPSIVPHVPDDYEEYLEPFVGGGSLFFTLQPKKAKLNDINPELINTYKQIRDNVDEVICRLESHQKAHSKEYYYKIRSMNVSRMKKVNRAARFIYLNKTCFNGLHRVNQKGQFNVPIGSYKNPKILDNANLRACSRALENTELFSMDYRDFLNEHSTPNSFIYLDPPYIPVSEYSDFDRYAEGKFRIGSQFDLSYMYSQLVESGANALLSNSSSELSYRLYSGFKVETVQANRFINKDGSKRGKVDEILVHPRRIREPSFPSTRYMGSKTSLLPYFSEILNKQNGSTVLDAFSGSGVVSYRLKKLGFEVISNDFLSYSSSVTTALIENNSVKLEADDIDLLLSKNRKAGKFVQTTFKDIYFYDDDNKFLDITLANIELLGCKYKKALARSALSRACLKRRPRGIFTYVGFKYDDGRKDLSFSLREHFLFSVDEFNKAVFSNNRKNKAYNMSALDLKIEDPDIVYLDPPYFSKHSDNDYVRRYHFIEGLCRNWKGVEIQEHTKTKKFKKYPSPFNTKTGAYEAFETLFNKYRNSTFLISYSSNSLPTKEELTTMLENVGKKVTLKEIDYKYSAGTQGHKVNNNNNDVQEYLFLAE
jgi:DNA adenine methylase